MKKFKGLMISTTILLCTATAGAVQANAGIGIWGDSYGTFCSGDINQDDECTVADAVLMQRYLLGQLSREEKFVLANIDLISTADLNLDGDIDVFDFIIMRDCLINPDSKNEISWCVDSFGTAKKEADETVGKEYIFTSAEQADEYFSSFAYEDCPCIGKYTDDFFEDNVLLMKPVFEDSTNNFYSINKIFYDGDTMNIDYTYNYFGEVSEELGDPVLLLVTVPKSRYHAEKISWNSKKSDWKPAIEFSKKSNITREEFLDLLISKEKFTWSDFEQYRSEDIGSGTHILKYEIEFEDSNDNVYLYVCGDIMDETPESIYLESPDGETIDIYELRRQVLDFIDGFKVPENSEADRSNVQKIAEYAFSELQNGTFDLRTELYDMISNEKLADCWKESHCLCLDFIDEHTVRITVNSGGFFDVYGYLVTDGTVEYEIGWNDNIDTSYDGGGMDIQERYDNLYFFCASL